MEKQSPPPAATATKTAAAPQKATIQSPCVRVCKLDSSGDYCIGCFRTRQELTVWSRASDTEKQKILDAALGRQHDFSQT